MRSTQPHTPARRRATGALLTALALGALALPGAARAANKTFSSGSIIIPTQLEYQTDDGVIASYGLVYAVLLRNLEASLPTGCTKPVTFYWAIAPNKLSQYRCNTNTNALPRYDAYNDNDGCDFDVQSADGVPVAALTASGGEQAPFSAWETAYTVASGPARGATVNLGDKNASPKKTVMKYLGAPFIVDATDRQCFLTMLDTYPELAQYHKDGTGSAHYVRIHSARASFSAPVARQLNQKPPLIAVTGGKAAFIINVLENAGLDAITSWNQGVVIDQKTEAELLDITVDNPQGLINNLDKKYGLFWGADAMAALTLAQRGNLNTFLNRGKGAYVEAASIDQLENRPDPADLVTTRPLVTTTGIVDYTPNVAYHEDCNDRKPGVTLYRSSGSGTCFRYGGLSQPWTQTGNFPFQGGQSDYKGFTPVDAFGAGTMVGLQFQDATTVTLSAARYYNNDLGKGLVIYLAGMRFDNARYWGQRMILNSVLANVPLLLGVELARSEPVGYEDKSSGTPVDKVYQGTYVQYPDPPEDTYRNYSTTFPHRWRFPYTRGHLYEYELGNIPTGSTAFKCSATSPAGTCPTVNWDAALRMPAPGARKIFTVLGGSAGIGWSQQIEVDYLQTRSGCLDQDADGKCDLSAALAQCNTAGVITETLERYDAASSVQRNQLGMFVQQVRGFCSSHDSSGNPRMTPSLSQCDDPDAQPNVAILGGIDHGSPAIVGPSNYVTDTAWATRPVVAYAGGRDGMLHAFYVSGGGNWRDPAGDGLPAGVRRGQELWAFLPPGQLCNLATNNAMVDASVNVIDVFASFPHDANGNGVIDWTSPDERPGWKREWRTVLLAAAGLGGSEMFAMDVTNPLKPVLLWHVRGDHEDDGRFDLGADGTWDTFDPTDPETYAIKWFDWDDGVASTAHIPTDYNTVDPDVLAAIKFGKYDYRNLGYTYGTAIGKVAVGTASQYVAYVATSMVDFTSSSPLGFRGVEVFAIDLVSGKKVWQWERKYTRANGAGTVIADNTIPGRVALVDLDSDGSVDNVYVGDLEGRMWELSARDGRNVNYYKDTATPPVWHSFPLFGTPDMVATSATTEIKDLFRVNGGATMAQQPLTSPIGQGRFTKVLTALEPYLLGRLAVVQGAMGVDWSIAPFENGAVYVVPVSPDWNTRVAVPVNVNATRDPRVYGMLKQDAAWKIDLLTGERVFGMPRVVNNEVIFNTAFGSFSGDITESITEAGNLYMVGTSTAGELAKTVTANQSKSFGGVLVFGNSLVVTTDTAITKKALPEALRTDGGPATRPFNRATPAMYKTWEPARAGGE
ncbi:hypothetical protein ACOQFB_03255 [Anaeromyxobacter sp. Red801]|uniref:hypothetical protein n=1 Tax=Anaeromyxobacter sp. Red801 TaxID=3411632 RepID=UPI003B9F6FDF